MVYCADTCRHKKQLLPVDALYFNLKFKNTTLGESNTKIKRSVQSMFYSNILCKHRAVPSLFFFFFFFKMVQMNPHKSKLRFSVRSLVLPLNNSQHKWYFQTPCSYFRFLLTYLQVSRVVSVNGVRGARRSMLVCTICCEAARLPTFFCCHKA